MIGYFIFSFIIFGIISLTVYIINNTKRECNMNIRNILDYTVELSKLSNKEVDELYNHNTLNNKLGIYGDYNKNQCLYNEYNRRMRKETNE